MLKKITFLFIFAGILLVAFIVVGHNSLKTSTITKEEFRGRFLDDIIDRNIDFEYFYESTAGGRSAIAYFKTNNFDIESYLKNNHYENICVKREGGFGGV